MRRRQKKGGGKKNKKKKKLKKDKSAFETVRDNVLLLLGDPVAGLTDEEKADWQLWILDLDKSPQDYVMETPWVFSSYTSFDDIHCYRVLKRATNSERSTNSRRMD